MDALDLLRAQHRELDDGFARMPAPSPAEQARAFELLGDAIELHLRLEGDHLYPALCELSLQGPAFQAEEEHASIARVLADVRALAPDDPRFTPALRVLCDRLRRHLRAEEERLFPLLERALPPALREALGQTMLETIAEVENENWAGAPTGAAW